MKANGVTQFLLLVIAISLAAIAIRPYMAPLSAKAQSESPYPFYIEPGTQMLRAPDGSKQVLGRVVIDMRTGRGLGLSHEWPGHLPGEPDEFQARGLAPL
jgi:hypothetical protein